MQTLSMHLALYCHSSLLKPYGYVWFPENVRERKLGGKMERKKKLRNIKIFTCLVSHGKFKGEKKKNSFSFVWLTMKKSLGKMEGKQNKFFFLYGYQFVE